MPALLIPHVLIQFVFLLSASAIQRLYIRLLIPGCWFYQVGGHAVVKITDW